MEAADRHTLGVRAGVAFLVRKLDRRQRVRPSGKARRRAAGPDRSLPPGCWSLPVRPSAPRGCPSNTPLVAEPPPQPPRFPRRRRTAAGGAGRPVGSNGRRGVPDVRGPPLRQPRPGGSNGGSHRGAQPQLPASGGGRWPGSPGLPRSSRRWPGWGRQRRTGPRCPREVPARGGIAEG